MIWQYLSGNSDPTRKKIIKLANAVNVNVEWLATGKGPMRVGEREKLNVNLLARLLKIYNNYEKKLGKPISHEEKAWAISAIFNFYSVRDIDDETVRSLMGQEVQSLHDLFQIYTRLINSGVGEERLREVLGDFFKQEWSDKEEAQDLADELIISRLVKKRPEK
jgi:transcriptional regulator with XRE-family HTH domain